MPRDLADVLHYFIPEAEPAEQRPLPGAPPVELAAAAAETPAPAHRVIGVPIGERDLVRAACVFNLCVELARLGSPGKVVTPAADAGSPLWPCPERGPLGTEVRHAEADDLESLERAARRAAALAPGESPGVVFARIPPRWLVRPSERPALLEWTLLFATPDPRDLLDAYGLAKLLRRAHPTGHIGLTIHGVAALEAASQAFHRVSRSVERSLGGRIASYGMILDDLEVYRAIADRRAVGLSRPQSSASRSLADVADLLLGDVRSFQGD